MLMHEKTCVFPIITLVGNLVRVEVGRCCQTCTDPGIFGFFCFLFFFLGGGGGGGGSKSV